MTTSVYKKAVRRFGRAQIAWLAAGGAAVKAVLIDLGAYTPDFDNHEFLSDIPAGARFGVPVALTLIDAADDGILDAADVTGYALPGTQPNLEAVAFFVDSGVAGTSPLIGLIDNRFQVEVADAAGGGATTLKTEDLPVAIASGAVLTKISGSGPATITTTASAAAGARSVSVSALGSGAAAGDVYEYAASGSSLPIAALATSVDLVWDNGPYKLFQI